MQPMKPMHWLEILTALVLLVPCLTGLSNPSPIDEPTDGISLPSMVPLHPAGISARITWPHIGNPAIILNGSELEIRVQAPAQLGYVAAPDSRGALAVSRRGQRIYPGILETRAQVTHYARPLRLRRRVLRR